MTMQTGQVAKILGVTPNAVQALADRGTIKCTRVPSGSTAFGYRVFDIDDVLGYKQVRDARIIAALKAANVEHAIGREQEAAA